jgi:hypothetical protein
MSKKNFIEVIYKKKVIAFVLKKSFFYSGIKFFTKKSSSLQVGYMSRNKNYKVNLHFHKENKLYVKSTVGEVLFVKKGKIELFLFSNDLKIKKKIICEAGSLVFLINCTHAINFLTKSELFEVRMGPYDKNNKVLLNMPTKSFGQYLDFQYSEKRSAGCLKKYFHILRKHFRIVSGFAFIHRG